MIQIHTFSEAGGHPVNEDAFVVRELPEYPDDCLICVADGQGGRAGGAKAARLACDTAALAFHTVCPWHDNMARADAAVAADAEAGFTTLIGFEVWHDSLAGASCGDSAVLSLCGSGQLVELTRHQHKNPPVGSGEAIFVPFEMKLTRPWKILAMTDGVWKYVGWDRVHALAKEHSGEELLSALQNAARLPRSGQFQDDFTVVLLEATD